MKDIGVAILNGLGVVPAARVLQRSSSVILTYHGVLDGSVADDFLDHNFIAAEEFDAQMRYLLRHYRPVTLSDLVGAYASGRTPPARSFAVTFDDGFANNFSVAYPILRRHGIPFTVFVTTGLLDTPGAQLWTERVKRSIYRFPSTSVVLPVSGRTTEFGLTSMKDRAASARTVLQVLKRLPPAQRDAALASIEGACGRPPIASGERERYDFLTWNQVREMSSAGVEFGSHTVSHPILTTLDAPTLEMELVASKQRIESELRRPCVAFAYPNGSPADYGPREKDALRSAGYTCGFSLGGGLNRQPDLYQIDRINVGRGLDLPKFQLEATGILGRARRARQAVIRRVTGASPPHGRARI